MKLLSWNVNGVRAVYRKGFMSWFKENRADVVCLQETKAHPEQLAEDMDGQQILHPEGYHSHWSSAEKKGYSGVAIYSKKEPLTVREGIGVKKFDSEGRTLTADFGDFILVNAYFPNSQRDAARIGFKVEFCQAMFKHLDSLRQRGKNVVICGDFNIAHKPIDLKNPKANEHNAGFRPEERAWMEEFIGAGWVDGFRQFEPGPNHYTWWSYRPGIRERNVGWRIDYFCCNGEFKDRLARCLHQPEVMGSDHCPVLLELQ